MPFDKCSKGTKFITFIKESPQKVITEEVSQKHEYKLPQNALEYSTTWLQFEHHGNYKLSNLKKKKINADW